ncbi:Calcium-binding mitochondrial carrier protein SCaMC-1 [Geodia barretti]|uniref:Calcium-binding mitochondrial carrier protein SCaMC-1 n=2 Tax=Geodia barretti TaxID=519541 RepID=A0AA35R0X9_GEOBA|nr:Calcium-binding mitochondrial carrier protein SCaMC-1 [Geodia barretti]
MGVDLLGLEALDRLQDVFNGIDEDKSGFISINEFTKACRELSMTVTTEELHDFICSDSSGDGELNFEEFCCFYSTRLKKVFDEIDTDRSGEIDWKELQRAFITLGYKATDREVRSLLTRVDTDKNEQIDFKEFCNYFCSLPSPSTRAVLERWASGLSIDTGSDLAPPALPPCSVEIWKALVAGGVAGIVSRTFTAPLEKAKIIAQTQTTRETQLSVSGVLSKIWSNERWRGLFAGNGANCIRVLPFSALVCLAYYNMAKNFPLDDGSIRKSAAMRICSGAMAGVFATLFTYPIDVARAKLTVQERTTKSYNGTFDALKVIAKNDKMSGLYRGIGPTIASIAPFVAIQQVTYDLLKYKAGNMSMEPSVLLFVGCGSAAGVAAQTVCYLSIGCYSAQTTVRK